MKYSFQNDLNSLVNHQLQGSWEFPPDPELSPEKLLNHLKALVRDSVIPTPYFKPNFFDKRQAKACLDLLDSYLSEVVKD